MAELPTPKGDGSFSHSLDFDIFWLDKPGDSTVRPCRPEHLDRLKKLRDDIRAAEAAGVDLSDDVVWLDIPGDSTVRPCRPSLLEHAKAERAKILDAQAMQNQNPPQDAK